MWQKMALDFLGCGLSDVLVPKTLDMTLFTTQIDMFKTDDDV